MASNVFLDTQEQSVSEAAGTAIVTVRRTGDLSAAATIIYGVTTDNATAGSDFVVPSGTAFIPAGADHVDIPIQILDDALSEPTESFVVSLISTNNGTLTAPRTDRVKILDDENPVPNVPPSQLISGYVVTTQIVADGAAGVDMPIGFEFIPTNPALMYVGEKSGVVRIYNVQTGQHVGDLLDISAEVNDIQDRGLLDVAVHPDFVNNPYLYVFYVVDPPDTVGGGGDDGPDGAGNRFAYVARYTLDASTNYMTVVAGSRTILLGGQGQTLADISGGGNLDFTDPGHSAATPSDQFVNAGNPGTIVNGFKQNYIKVDSRSHAGGSLAFGPDGKLYVSIGDGTSYNYADPRAPNVQSLDGLNGKILRIDPITGQGLTDNPFYTGGLSLDSNRSKIFQLGLRNPFSMGFDSNGRLFISDTGWNSWEEINTGGPGANFGWPYYEGSDGGLLAKTPVYEDFAAAPAFYNDVALGNIVITPAFRAFAHDSAQPGFSNQVITGGDVVYTGSRYPTEFLNDYFFTDFANGNVFVVDVNNRQDVKFLYHATTTPEQFAPAHFKQGPDGYVYASDLLTGNILRLLITPIPKPPPRIMLPSGSTVVGGEINEWVLTPASQDELGALMSTTRINLTQNFTISFSVNLGSNDGSGADGLGFVLHNDSHGSHSFGGLGGSFGVVGISNGLAIVFDTFQNDGEIANDSTSFVTTATGARTPASDLGNIEDGAFHQVVVTWNAATSTLSYTFDGVQRGSMTDVNLASTYFNGSNLVHFGFGAATGGFFNSHTVRLTNASVAYENARNRDINFDGRSDLLWQNDNGTPAAWFLNGTTLLGGGVPANVNPGPQWRAVATGDFNGDGRSDILWRKTDGTPAIWLLDGTTLLGGGIPAGVNPGTQWQAIGTGDFNGDGKSDILWQHDNGTPTIWFLDGTTFLGGGIPAGVNPGADWTAKASGDFNGDGKSDILWQHDNGTPVVWLLDGTNLLSGGVPAGVNPGASWRVISSGDFNGDGKSDILWQNTDGTPVIWLLDGTTLLGGGVAGGTNPGPAWHAVGTGDYNGDGKSDILWQHDNGTPAVWHMSGTTLLGGGVPAGVNPGSTWHLIGQGN